MEKEPGDWKLKTTKLREVSACINRILRSPVAGILRAPAARMKQQLVGTQASLNGWDAEADSKLLDLMKNVEIPNPSRNNAL